MTTYMWPNLSDWRPEHFELRVVPNTRIFTGQYTPTVQVIDLLGERWHVIMELPGRVNNVLGAAFEAFFDRLKGPVNRIRLWNLKFPAPQGTIRQTDQQTVLVQNSTPATVTVQNSSLATVTVVDGTPVLPRYVPQGANAATVQGIAGKTLKAGDMLGLGSGQTVRVMADATLDGTGNAAVEFQPRARTNISAYTQLVTDKPTIDFILSASAVPVVWRDVHFEGLSFEAVEVF